MLSGGVFSRQRGGANLFEARSRFISKLNDRRIEQGVVAAGDRADLGDPPTERKLLIESRGQHQVGRQQQHDCRSDLCGIGGR